MPPPDLEPTLQLGLLEPEVRVEAVGEDGVSGGLKPSSTPLDLAGQEWRGYALGSRVGQVVGFGRLLLMKIARLSAGTSGSWSRGSVEQRIIEMVSIHGSNGEVVTRTTSFPSQWLSRWNL